MDYFCTSSKAVYYLIASGGHRQAVSQYRNHSEWEVSGAKPRKYYSLSETGGAVYQILCDEWAVMAKNMNKLINEKGDGQDGID